MKHLLVLALFGLTAQSAFSACLGEAQIIARISSIEPVSSGLCIAQIEAADVRFFSENQLCPLTLDEVVASGIFVKADNTQCFLSADGELSGVVKVNGDGDLVLE